MLSELVEMREQQRFEWERILFLQRSMLIAMANRLAREGRIHSVDEIWFLNWAELLGLSAGEDQLDPQELEYRRHVHRVEKSIRVPQIIPAFHNEDKIPFSTALRGLGASSGRASGPVVVVRDSDDTYPRKGKEIILVMTNMSPADTPVLLGISGLVLERGGLLSHAAIMAREYGIPLVTAASGATEALHTGMIATVDGDTGIVEFG
jgi:pyruvate,water dikinase